MHEIAYGDRGADGIGRREELLAYVLIMRVVLHVGHEHVRHHDVGHRPARGFNQFLDVAENLSPLRLGIDF